MPERFPGFPKECLQFFKDLTQHNSKDWFHANKKVYEQSVKAPMIRLVEAINAELAKVAPDYRSDPKKAISRINKDIRFSKDKSPYRTDISAVFPCKGKEKQESAGFYFGVSLAGVDVVGGAYMPDPDSLRLLRACLAGRHNAFRKIVAAAPLKSVMGTLQGEQLQRVPKDYPQDHPAGELLRYKQLYLRKVLPVELVTKSDLQAELVRCFRAMVPFVEFLDAGLGKPAEG